MLNKKRTLTAAVLLSCSFIMAPYYAHAEEEKPSCDHPSSYMTVKAGNLTYNFDIYNASTHPGDHWRGEYEENDDGDYILDANGQRIKVYTFYRPLFTNEEKAFGDSIAYIHKMLNPTKAFSPTIKLELLPENDANAAASSETHITYDSNGKPVQIGDTKLAAVLQGKYKPEGNDIVAEIEVDLAPAGTSWYIDKFPVLPSNGINSDYYGTIAHEIFHAFGLVANVSADSSGDITFGTSGNYYDSGYFRSMAVFNKYEMGLRDVFGRVGYYALDSNNNYHDYDENPINPNNTTSIANINGTLMSRNIVSISVEQYNNLLNDRNSIDSQTFYILRDPVNNTDDDTEDDEVESVDRYANQSSTSSSASLPEGTKINQNGGVYFTGAHIKDVLTTGSDVAKIAWPDGSTVPAVEGLPINCYEGSDENSPELSHIELQNGQMSHQNYRNWCSFMEAELALMQDLGYDIDRGAYFGKSIYNSGTVNEEGTITYFSYNNEQTFYSTQMHGIGLHVYGSYVDVKQTGELKTDGYSGIGIRVDGVGNKLTINTDITANGDYGNGLLVAYGKNHEITLNEGKSIQATGEDGVAARFDFGSNELGDQAGYRGSYINTKYTSQEEIDERAKKNPEAAAEMQVGWSEITIDDLPTAIQGALVENFNLSGKLVGKKAAIYISPNAYVKNINILDTADIQGNIISEWNPNEIFYQNEDGSTIAPLLPDGEGLTNLNFYGTHTFTDKIFGQDSIVLNIGQNSTATANILTTSDSTIGSTSAGISSGGSAAPVSTTDTLTTTDFINVQEINILNGSTFNNQGILTVCGGAGDINIDGTFNNANGRIFSRVNDDGALLHINGTGDLKLDNSQIILGMMHDFYDGDIVLNANWEPTLNVQGTPKINLLEQSPTLDFVGSLDTANDRYIIKMRRNYEQYAYDSGTNELAKALQQNAAFLGNQSTLYDDWQKIYEGIDFSKTDGSQVSGALKQLNPSVYSNSAQVTLNTHSTLNNMNMLGGFSNNVPAARTGGGRGPAIDVTPKYNSWRNIVMPFSAYTDQHHGMRGYTNHNSGVIGALERTLENGLTHGYHAAVNHQSTSEAGSRIKGEGIYFGAQASYSPADWNGWQIFGSARLGLEQMRSHRNVTIGSYSGNADADWTGYSGSLNIGTALTKEHGIMQSGPFAALDYSFAHRPNVHEDGGAIRTELASATYDSLRTQLGYRIATSPKSLDSYDSTKWQAHASIAWNHELLSDNGSTSYSLADLPGVTITDKAESYGRDSMSVAAGVTFKTPKKLDVGLTLGSDIYRKGGSSVYGKVNLEWKF